jgi:hypothetical protein
MIALKRQNKEFLMKKTLAVLVVGTVLPLCAYESVRFGAQLSTTTPLSTFHHQEAGQGYGLGGFVSYNVCEGQAAVLKSDANSFAKLGHSANKTYAGTTTLGVDYVMHLEKKDVGFYGLAGMDVERKRLHKTVEAVKEHKHINKIGYTVGAGYDVTNNLGVQVRYNIHKDKKTLSTVSTGVTYKF